jgi:hypothetical protein
VSEDDETVATAPLVAPAGPHDLVLVAIAGDPPRPIGWTDAAPS